MKTGSPWIRFYPDDWEGGVCGMNISERCVYMTLIVRMYGSGKPIEEDYGMIARMCGGSNGTVKRALNTLIRRGKIIRVEDGLWNKRVGEELAYSLQKASAARESANARWGKKDNKNNEAEMRTHYEGNANQNQNQISKKEIPIGISKKENFEFDFSGDFVSRENEAVGEVAGGNLAGENSERLQAENPVPVGIAAGGQEPEGGGFRLEVPDYKTSAKKAKKSGRKRTTDPKDETPIPQDWAVSESGTDYALKKGIPADKIADEVEKFKLHWENKPVKHALKRNWDKAWNTWVLNAYLAYERRRKWDEERSKNFEQRKQREEDPYADLYASLQ